MAKTLRKIKHVILEADATGLSFGKALILYQIGSTDDPTLKSEIYEPLELTTGDITQLTNIFGDMKAKVTAKQGV